MKILSSRLELPRWQKDINTLDTTDVSGADFDSDNQSCPLSVLPKNIQDRLRAGETVDVKDCIPVPTGLEP